MQQQIIFRKETSPNMATQVTSKAKINQNATKYQSKPMQAYSNWFISRENQTKYSSPSFTQLLYFQSKPFQTQQNNLDKTCIFDCFALPSYEHASQSTFFSI